MSLNDAERKLALPPVKESIEQNEVWIFVPVIVEKKAEFPVKEFIEHIENLPEFPVIDGEIMSLLLTMSLVISDVLMSDEQILFPWIVWKEAEVPVKEKHSISFDAQEDISIVFPNIYSKLLFEPVIIFVPTFPKIASEPTIEPKVALEE